MEHERRPLTPAERKRRARLAAERRARQWERLRPILALPLIPGRITSTAEACVRLNCSRTTLWRLKHDGVLPKTILSDDLAALIEARRSGTTEAA